MDSSPAGAVDEKGATLPGRPAGMEGTKVSPGNTAQTQPAKFFAAKSQLARLARKVSTNFGRALR